MTPLTKRKHGKIQQNDIIAAILAGRNDIVGEILKSNPNAINSINEPNGMNAAMLAAYGRLHEIFDTLIATSGHLLDFHHTDIVGDDLLAVALGTLDAPLVDKVQNAFERHAPHIINNWPEP